MKKNKFFLILFLSFFSFFNISSSAAPPSDDEIANKLIYMGIINGYEDGSLRLDNTITRGEIVTVLTRILHPNDISISKLPFLDIEDHWAKKSICQIESLKIINGFEDGTFKPNNPITNTETIALLSRIVKKEHLLDSSVEWPYNYLNLGASLGFYELPVDSHNATRREVFHLIFLALDMKL